MTLRARPRGTALLLLVAVLAVLAAPAPARPSAAAAAGAVSVAERPALGAGNLSVRISGFTPAIPEPGDELSIRGSLTNTSAQPVSSVAVQLRLSPTPVVNRDEIPEVLAGVGQRTGSAVAGTRVPVADGLAPGASADFQLDAAVDDLPLGTDGVYVTGAEALGDSGSGQVRQDIDRTFLPWWTDGAAVEPVRLTTLWPLTGAPLRDASGVLFTEDPAIALSPGGRLSRLLDAGAQDPGAVSLVIDPELAQMAAAMADGYQVRTASGTIEEGTRSQEAQRWLEQLRRTLAAPEVDAAGSLYAWPDVDAVRRGKLLNTVLRQQAQSQERATVILGRRLGPPLVLAPGGVALPRTLTTLSRSAVRAVVLADRAAPLVEPTYFTPSGNVVLPTGGQDLPALLADSGLARTLSLPMADPAEQTAARQALLAQTLVAATELPETQRLLVAALDPTWDPPAGAAQMVADALSGAPWVVPTGVADALSREPGTLPRVAVAPTAEEVDQELPAGHVEQVRTQYQDLRDYAAIVAEPDRIPAVTTTAPTRLLGAWLRTDPETRNGLTAVVQSQIENRLESVRVVSSGSITVSGASGSIPITVDNDGPQPVTVGLSLSSTPPQLFTADPVEPFTVDPGRRTSVVVTAQVAASGPIPVTIRLLTSAGEPFGDPGQLVVESAAYANAARVLVQLAIVALVITVAVHGVRRARRRRSSGSRGRGRQEPPPTTSAAASARPGSVLDGSPGQGSAEAERD